MNTFDLFSLKGKNVLITGGRAMYGQGATQALADAGANIYVASHSVESAKDFCENLSKEKGVKVQAVAFDRAILKASRRW
jgi:2-deoxy-D-gluconate 3-dehydrogenase